MTDILRGDDLHRLDKVRLSIRSQHQLGHLKHKTNIPINVLARFGICLSLNDSSIPNPDIYDEKGMELMPHILYGKNELIFSTMFQYRFKQDNLDYEEYGSRMIRAHINRGSGMLFPRIKHVGDFSKLFGNVA